MVTNLLLCLHSANKIRCTVHGTPLLLFSNDGNASHISTSSFLLKTSHRSRHHQSHKYQQQRRPVCRRRRRRRRGHLRPRPPPPPPPPLFGLGILQIHDDSAEYFFPSPFPTPISRTEEDEGKKRILNVTLLRILYGIRRERVLSFSSAIIARYLKDNF